MERKPIVGIMPLWDEEKESLWVLPGYLEGVMSAGALPVIFPFLENAEDIYRLMASCDGFLFTGGQDVDPLLYKEKPLNEEVITCPKRDMMEKIVFEKALADDKPVLGICRGIQFINVILGGSLYQDIPELYVTNVEHHQQPPYDRPIHMVDIVSGTPLYKTLRKGSLAVNSYHHQAVKKLAPSLKAMAYSEDRLIEALYKPDQKFVWAVQWHPEFNFASDVNSQLIFKAFVKAML